MWCEDTRVHIGIARCPDCKLEHLNIYADGSYHCGSCLSGGMLICYDPFKNGRHTHAHLIPKFIDKITNPVIIGFDCKTKEHGKEKCPYIERLNGKFNPLPSGVIK